MLNYTYHILFCINRSSVCCISVCKLFHLKYKRIPIVVIVVVAVVIVIIAIIISFSFYLCISLCFLCILVFECSRPMLLANIPKMKWRLKMIVLVVVNNLCLNLDIINWFNLFLVCFRLHVCLCCCFVFVLCIISPWLYSSARKSTKIYYYYYYYYYCYHIHAYYSWARVV
jgi:hypothetical protein